MKLVGFSVNNYRSITNARKLPIKDFTVLIGANNEGKSNILKALVTAFQLLGELDKDSRPRIIHAGVVRPLYNSKHAYNWERDFPISLQQLEPNGKTTFALEFLLEDGEVDKFKAEVGSNLNGSLPIKIEIGQSGLEFKVAKKGPGGKSLSSKKEKIAKFVINSFDCVEIPTVRTHELSQGVVERMVSRELRRIESDPKYIAALEGIKDLQKPVLEEIASNIAATLKLFIPNVKNVGLEFSQDAFYHSMRRSCEIIIDDGTPTSLQFKGDGIKSLAALGLIRHSSVNNADGRFLVLAIEEPESHLHPAAVHQLREVLVDISKSHQVIITTHSPILVNKGDIGSNIVVTANQGVPARDIKTIRDTLGVKASDNLRNAELVLVVEGTDDRESVVALLQHHSKHLKTALNTGVIAVESMGGGSNLSYKVTQLSGLLCNFHCLLDYDKTARDAKQKAMDNRLLIDADVTFTTCPGMSESEFEDLLNVNLYKEIVLRKYGVDLEVKKFKHKKAKFSERLKDCFLAQGKEFSDRTKQQVKTDISSLIKQSPAIALQDQCRSSLDALIQTLERLTKKIS